MSTAPSTPRSIALETHGLVKRFGGIVATDHVSLQVAHGARHALIGPNGAGKTTLINLMTGVLPATEGRIVLQGEDITPLAPHDRVGRGLVRTFQINQLFSSFSPLETLTMVVSQHRGLGRRWWQPLGQRADVVERAEQLLEQFHLTDVCEQRTEHLAYGKRRLLEMAIALACEPRVLLLDEPVAGVPAGERDELLHTVAQLPADVSVVLIEHEMNVIERVTERCIVLNYGRKIAEGSYAEITADPAVQTAYLGEAA